MDDGLLDRWTRTRTSNNPTIPSICYGLARCEKTGRILQSSGMKKVALVFVLAVFVPSLVLAWLAVRSLRDQQFLLEKQQSLLYQGVADALAKQVQDLLADYQRNFTTKTTELLRDRNPQVIAKTFDEVLRGDWPVAQVGFVVALSGS